MSIIKKRVTAETQPVGSRQPFAGWARIIEVVRSPLSFFTLAVLILQGILLALVPRAQGTNFTVLVVGSMVLTALVIIGVIVMQFRPREFKITNTRSIAELRYDAFLSVPMASLSEHEYATEHKLALEVCRLLRAECGLQTVYFAGQDIASKAKFNPPDLAVTDDLAAVEASRYFVMLYPKKVASSVIVEAGFAIALAKNSIYLVRSRDHLPFLLRQAEQAFQNVKVYTFNDAEDIKRLLSRREVLTFK